MTSFMYRERPRSNLLIQFAKKCRLLGPFPIFNVGEGPSCNLHETDSYIHNCLLRQTTSCSIFFGGFPLHSFIYYSVDFISQNYSWNGKLKVNWLNDMSTMLIFAFLQWFRASSLWYPLHLWFQAYDVKLADWYLNDVTSLSCPSL